LKGISLEMGLELLVLAPNADVVPKLGADIVLPNEDWPKAGVCVLLVTGDASGVLLNPPPAPKAETNEEVCVGVFDGELKGEDPVFITPKALYPVPLRNGLLLGVEDVSFCERDLSRSKH
jgi:hypothetical protein